MLKGIQILLLSAWTVILAGCAAGVDNPGVEYSPQMYHSIPYEPLSQIQDKSMGSWLDSNPDDGHGEFYNSNPYNPYGMTMLEPVPNTIKRGQALPAHIAPDDYETAAIELINPLDSGKEVVSQGKVLYERFCIQCHGPKGQGDGLVGEVFLGVTSYTSATVVDKPGGHLFHVITNGKGRMGAHGSQLSVEERWKIVRYVQTLQKQ